MFTVMFAIARTAGWVAHWQEMIADPEMKIARPRQLYTGPRAATTSRSPSAREVKGDSHLFRYARTATCGRKGMSPFTLFRDEHFYFRERRAAHRLAVHRARRRLADSILREDGRIDLMPAGREAQGRERLDLVALLPEAAFRDSCGMPRSMSRTATDSGVSANRCSVMSLWAVAVPESSGPTSRGSNSARRRIAWSATRARRQRNRVRLGFEQPLVLGERFLDLGVPGKHGEVGHAEALAALRLAMP